MNTNRVLIVGQGFAGSLLAWMLIRKGVSVTVADDLPEFSSTKVAAGIILPVTGRRLAKTHLADITVPFARHTYQSIGKVTGQELFFPKDVLQVFSSVANKNEWYARSADAEMTGYCGPVIPAPAMHPSVKNSYGAIVLKQCGYVEPQKLLAAINAYIRQHGVFIHQQVDSGHMEISNRSIEFMGKSYSHIIFCEGYHCMHNRYFNYLPFKPAKGEIIDFVSPGLTHEYIVNTGAYILPLGEGVFRSGATYVWDDITEMPTPAGYGYLIDNLEKSIACDYTVTAHKAGIRPAISDRRPVIGFHPEHKRVGVFNGLGTKGALLGPYYARQMADLLTEGKDPDRDVDVRRFDALLRVT